MFVSACLRAKALHFFPDIASIQGFSGLGDKDGTGLDAQFFHILLQLFLQGCHDKYGSGFSLTGHPCGAGQDGLCRDIWQLADTNSRAANGLKQQ